MIVGTILPPIVAVFAFVSVGFIVSILIKRNDIADVMWGPGIALAAHTAVWASGSTPTNLQLLLLTVISLWAIRLGVRIGRKNFSKSGEDSRYKRWRDSWRYFYLRSYLQVFILQGALMLVLAYPVIHTTLTPGSVPTPILIIGLLVWVIGFFFEVVGDTQLDRFLRSPSNKGRLKRYGLWRYSRHPNYFGEITMWWAIGFLTLTLPLGWMTLLSPVVITLLIRYVSGVPLLEAHFKDHPEWVEYERTTSMLVPLPPRS